MRVAGLLPPISENEPSRQLGEWQVNVTFPKTSSMQIVRQKGTSRNRPTLPGWQRIRPVFGSAKESRAPAKALGDNLGQRTPPQMSRCLRLEHCRANVRIGS